MKDLYYSSSVSISQQYANVQNGDADVSHSAKATVDEGAAAAARTSRSRTEAAASGATCSVKYVGPEGASQYSERRCTSTGVASKYPTVPATIPCTSSSCV